MTQWLYAHGFSYKKPNLQKQTLRNKLNSLPLMKTLCAQHLRMSLFGDGVHPTMATKVSYGWIRKGKDNDKIISTTASRTRMNLIGSLNLETMHLIATKQSIAKQ